MITIFLCNSLRSKGYFPRLLVGQLRTPKLAQIFAYGKWLYWYRIQLYGASDLDQRCLKTRNFEDGCKYFPTKYIRPYPQTHPKTQFWGSFNTNRIVHGALRKSHVNGATKLKLYTVLVENGVCRNFSAMGRPGGGAQGTLMQLWDPHIISETRPTGARKLELKTQLDVVKYSIRVQ